MQFIHSCPSFCAQLFITHKVIGHKESKLKTQASCQLTLAGPWKFYIIIILDKMDSQHLANFAGK